MKKALAALVILMTLFIAGETRAPAAISCTLPDERMGYRIETALKNGDVVWDIRTEKWVNLNRLNRFIALVHACYPVSLRIVRFGDGENITDLLYNGESIEYTNGIYGEWGSPILTKLKAEDIYRSGDGYYIKTYASTTDMRIVWGA